MIFIDIILIGILFLFVYKGIKDGFIDTFCSLLAIVVGLYVSNWANTSAANWLMKLTGWGMTFSRIAMFVIIFVAVDRLITWLIYLAQRFLDTLARLPVIKSLNKLLGGLLGALIGIIVLGVLVYTVKRFGHGAIALVVNQSTIAGYIAQGLAFIAPYIPKLILGL